MGRSAGTRLGAAAALVSGFCGAQLASASCPDPFLKQQSNYLAHDDAFPDPFPGETAGTYGTPQGPSDASLEGAFAKCLAVAEDPQNPCKGFTFQHGSSDDDISKGVFFYGNDKLWQNSDFVAYQLNPAYDPACKTTPVPAGGTPAPGASPPSGGGSSSGGCGGGCAFLIIFFVGGFVYFAAGFAYNSVRRELRGVEAIPHVDFWKDLPVLVKDGVVFTVNKVRGAGGGYSTV
eukprot:TRINITY_DN6302_c0_g1_i1.p1 TRINITY_DN6302_c0_g1~~TRINITY_DN6302_c0_g1_i1.p1  ORF type:complete len:262 (+),score=68.77 TRINITY_DN6302_c0_g1_i1:90-788(+)